MVQTQASRPPSYGSSDDRACMSGFDAPFALLPMMDFQYAAVGTPLRTAGNAVSVVGLGMALYAKWSRLDLSACTASPRMSGISWGIGAGSPAIMATRFPVCGSSTVTTWYGLVSWKAIIAASSSPMCCFALETFNQTLLNLPVMTPLHRLLPVHYKSP